jgi:hypothetical protein
MLFRNDSLYQIILRHIRAEKLCNKRCNSLISLILHLQIQIIYGIHTTFLAFEIIKFLHVTVDIRFLSHTKHTENPLQRPISVSSFGKSVAYLHVRAEFGTHVTEHLCHNEFKIRNFC